MALKIRLSRRGSIHNPVYRLVVAESTSRRDGRFVETLGTYSPKKPENEQLDFRMERVEHWVSVGAKPTDTARTLIAKARRTAEASA